MPHNDEQDDQPDAPEGSLAPDGADNAPGEDPIDRASARILQLLQEFSAKARVDSEAPLGLLHHEVVADTGLPRYHVRRALMLMVASGRCEKIGSRYCLPGEGAEVLQRTAQRKTQRIKRAARPEDPSQDQAPSSPSQPDNQGPPPHRMEHRPSPSTCVGQLRVHPAGYGFVQRDDGEDDVFVSARGRGTALDGDRVLLTIWMGYKGPEGRVLEVLSRGRARLTGVVVAKDRGGGKAGYAQPRARGFSLQPDDPRLVTQEPVLLPEGPGGAHVGQSVLAEITRYPSHLGEPMTARVLQVLGEPGQLRTELAKALMCADIPDAFPDEVSRAGDRAPAEVTHLDLCDRLDLRDRPFVTIDPENARDFDDAVCVEPAPREGRSGPLDRLWVAVADVSHYVRPGTVLDSEARVRGCSIYLPDRVISMLPLPLSAGICSLNPDVDRLAMVVALDIDRAGNVVHTHFAAAVIRSHGRLDYPGVALALSSPESLRGGHARYREHLPQLRKLQEVAGRLRRRRLERGALDFELPEARVVLDESDPEKVSDVLRSRQSAAVRDAYRLIEDCMVAANEAVARFFTERGLPSVYRVHDTPDEERLQAFAALALSHGLRFDPEAARAPLYLRTFLMQLKGRPMEQALSYLLLRALKKAHYDVTNIGHFGLAATDYLHFTSPIRRYPDLLVHRLLKLHLRREGVPGGGISKQALPEKEELMRFATESSRAERRAMEVEREVVDLYRAVLMRDQIGQEFDGTVVGITAFGLFVALDAPYVEGLIKTESLGTGYVFDEQTVRLSGRHGLSFSLGVRVRVRIDGVSVSRRKIDLGLVHLLPAAETEAGEAAGEPAAAPATPAAAARGQEKGQIPRRRAKVAQPEGAPGRKRAAKGQGRGRGQEKKGSGPRAKGAKGHKTKPTSRRR
jgi:ribonuclease R